MNVRPLHWGKYELVERLGRGGMGEVWKARITGAAGFSRQLVVKRLLPHLLEDHRFVEMFLTEARLSAQLEHPNIVQIFELGDVDGEFFLAMEYVQGRDLGRLIGHYVLLHERPPVPMAVYVVREVCRALSYAHQLTDKHGARLGLIHRDISPSNVMLATTGAVKLLDFGVAKAASESQNQATQTGVLKGKLWYMAPERVEGKSFDHRSDIFSTGVVLHETLTATRLFEASNPAKVINLICNKPIEPPSKINPDVPIELDAICLKALARDPDRRYATADEMAEDLDELLFNMRWGAEQLAKLIQTTFSHGTHVAASALDPSTEERVPGASPPHTARAKGLVTPSRESPSRETTAPRPRLDEAPSRATTSPVARETMGVIDADKTTQTVAPPASFGNTTAKNPVLDDTNEAPLLPGTAPGTLAAPTEPAPAPRVPGLAPPSFDENTRLTPPQPPRVADAPTLAQRLLPWRWPLAVAAAILAATFAIIVVARAHSAASAQAASIELTVTSKPPGAHVVVDGAAHLDGTTPLTTRVPREGSSILNVTYPGYEPYSEPLPTDKDLRLHIVLRPLR